MHELKENRPASTEEEPQSSMAMNDGGYPPLTAAASNRIPITASAPVAGNQPFLVAQRAFGPAPPYAFSRASLNIPINQSHPMFTNFIPAGAPNPLQTRPPNTRQDFQPTQTPSMGPIPTQSVVNLPSISQINSFLPTAGVNTLMQPTPNLKRTAANSPTTSSENRNESIQRILPQRRINLPDCARCKKEPVEPHAVYCCGSMYCYTCLESKIAAAISEGGIVTCDKCKKPMGENPTQQKTSRAEMVPADSSEMYELKENRPASTEEELQFAAVEKPRRNVRQRIRRSFQVDPICPKCQKQPENPHAVYCCGSKYCHTCLESKMAAAASEGSIITCDNCKKPMGENPTQQKTSRAEMVPADSSELSQPPAKISRIDPGPSCSKGTPQSSKIDCIIEQLGEIRSISPEQMADQLPKLIKKFENLANNEKLSDKEFSDFIDNLKILLEVKALKEEKVKERKQLVVDFIKKCNSQIDSIKQHTSQFARNTAAQELQLLAQLKNLLDEFCKNYLNILKKNIANSNEKSNTAC